MRRLLPLALLLVGCSKPAPPPTPKTTATPPPKPTASFTPKSMAEAMDVPFYPGAEAPDGLSTTPEKRTDGSTHYSLVLATKDPVDKAAKWYADTMSLPAMSMGKGKNLIGKTPKGNDLIVQVGPEGGRTLIRIKSIAYAK